MEPEPEQFLSRTERILAIHLYNLDYIIYNRETGEELDDSIDEYDETTQTIKILNIKDFYKSTL